MDRLLEAFAARRGETDGKAALVKCFESPGEAAEFKETKLLRMSIWIKCMDTFAADSFSSKQGFNAVGGKDAWVSNS